MFDRITLDAYNNSAYVVLNGVNHLFSSYTRFVELTNFNFPDTINVSYEPDRDMFVVERKGGILLSASDLPEIEWCRGNIDNVISAAHSDGYGQLPPGPTLTELRNIKLYETDWMVTRHRDQIEAGIPTSLSNLQYTQLLNYRQELRDITTRYTSIDDVVWPILDL